MLLKLPIRTVGALSRMRALIKKNTYKGALIGRRTLVESLRYLCQGLVKCRKYYKL